MPEVFIIAGPNGSGKTTLAFKLIPNSFELKEFVNADIIASGLSAFNLDSVAIAAGKLMLHKIKENVSLKKNFAFETTLSSKSFFPFLKKIKIEGYKINLIYIWLKNPELAIDRIRNRILIGGHFIPDEVVKRRYYRSMKNLVNLYLPIADRWEIYDNSYITAQLVAKKEVNSDKKIFLTETFSKIMNQTIKEPSSDYSSDKIEKAVKEAIEEELEKRRRLGLPIAIWKNGKVVNLSPEEFEILRDQEKEKNKK